MLVAFARAALALPLADESSDPNLVEFNAEREIAASEHAACGNLAR